MTKPTKGKKNEITRFKIYPFNKAQDKHDKTCWWEVIIYEDLKALRKNVCKKCLVCETPFKGGKDMLGLTHSHGGKTKVDNFGNVIDPMMGGELGTIYLQKENIGSNVVSHEICHAVLYTVSRKVGVINFYDPSWHFADEDIAWMLGSMVSQTFTVLYEAKVIPGIKR